MATNTHTVERGAEYVVRYADGPFDGQTDTRISTDGAVDTELTLLAAEDGTEARFVYALESTEEIGGVVHGHYRWDRPDSDALEADEERARGDQL